MGDAELMDRIRAVLGAEALGEAAAKIAAVDAANTRVFAASLGALQQNSQSNIGRIAYNTGLAIAAGAGEHSCDPADPCDPADRCDAAEPLDGVSLTQRAESLGVRINTFRKAHVRMHNTNHSIPPPQALEDGCYCWAKRKVRIDATNSRVLDMGTRFWHSDDVSRASGDSGKLHWCCVGIP